HRRRGALDELAEAQVLVDDRDRVFLYRPSFDGFFQGTATIQARARAAPVPAFAHVVGLVHGRGALRLEVGELQLLPDPVDALLELHLDHEAALAVLGAARLRLGVALLAPLLQHVAGLALALPGALLRARVGEAETRVLEELDRHHHGAVLAVAGHQI